MFSFKAPLVVLCLKAVPCCCCCVYPFLIRATCRPDFLSKKTPQFKAVSCSVATLVCMNPTLALLLWRILPSKEAPIVHFIGLKTRCVKKWISRFLWWTIDSPNKFGLWSTVILKLVLGLWAIDTLVRTQCQGDKYYYASPDLWLFVCV